MKLVPLHVYSGFSYLKSGIPVEKVPYYAKMTGYTCIGISDYMNLNGFAPFTHQCNKYGIKPYYLMDLELNGNIYSLFVKNEEGYRNLLKLSLRASDNRVTYEDLLNNNAGLEIVFNPDMSFLIDEWDKCDESKLALKLKAVLPTNNTYIGIPFIDNRPFVTWLRDFCKSHSYNSIAFPFIAYPRRKDAIVTRITKAINDKEHLTETEMIGDHFFLNFKQANKYYTQEEILATNKLVDTCDFTFIKKRGTLLTYENNYGLSSKDYLMQLAYKGLQKKLGNITDIYKERLDYELKIINQMGYDDYFLLVCDYVNYAKKNNITVGPGRGSGPASLVSFALDISTPDPIENGLLFERFLNPERQSMPDIDVDFSDINRDKVVNYLQNKYGERRVAKVLTAQTIGAKEALRDIGRIYQISDREIELIISTIVNDKVSLKENYKISKKLRDLVNSDKYFLQIVGLASRIEGLPRQSGIHAAGVLINDEPLDIVMPIKNDSEIGYIGCLEKDYLEEQGFLKMDILGLRNLSLIDECLYFVKRDYGITLHLDDIPYNDKDSISLIKQDKTMGLFQLESRGMRRAIKEVQPTDFNDIVALIALFRPGPMESIPIYARRKQGRESIKYLDPDLEPILSNTYGVIVYQEQIMQITQAVAGFSLGEADLFRRAISKKNVKEMESYHDKFIKGCLDNNKNIRLAEELFRLIHKFAGYGFNKAHAVAYATLTCKMAYLKKHYPDAFYCALLDSLSISENKFMDTMNELNDLNITLATPSVNKSDLSYKIVDNKLIFPLISLKNTSRNFLCEIYDERVRNGEFTDIFDFSERMISYGLTLPLLIKLIDSGSMDDWGISRATLRATAPRAMNYANMLKGKDGQAILLDFGIEKPTYKEAIDNKKINLEAEYEILGMMLSDSPLSIHKEEIKKQGAVRIKDVSKYRKFRVAGIIGEVRPTITKKGKQICFFNLYDEMNQISFVMWAETYEKTIQYLKEDNLVIVEGINNPKGLVCNNIKPLGGN